MRRVRRKNTTPEMAVRKALHANGYRFRVHRRDLPGSPDIVLPKHHLAIFVHGCFWHRHADCPKATTPKTREEFWKEKFATNQARDTRVIRALREQSWAVVVVWECEIRSNEWLERVRTAIEERLS